MKDFFSWLYDEVIDLFVTPATPRNGAAIGGHIWLGSGYDAMSDENETREAICAWAKAQEGVPYHLGVENNPNDPAPKEEDCSELVEMAYRHAGKTIVDGSNYQFDACRAVREPKPADLGFLWSDKWGRIGHVVIYLGYDQIVEARGGSVGKVRIAPRSVIEADVRFRGWRRHPDFTCPVEERA